MSDIIDLGIIRFEPAANIADQEYLTAAVDAIETYVSVDLGIDGLWIISIDGDFVADEYPDPRSACIAALGHLIVHAVDIVLQAPGIDDADMQRRATLCRDWLNMVVSKFRERGAPPDVHLALNSGDGT